MYTLQELITLTEHVCNDMGRAYRIEPSDLYSYCLARAHNLFLKINQDLPRKTIISYIKKSIKGYCLHCIRDEVPIIRTPRGKDDDGNFFQPYQFVALLDCDQLS